MRNFKKNIYPVLFLAVIICMNQILILALKPCTNFRNDIHKLETNQYDDLFVGTSHGKAGINPEVVDKITGERSLNLCLGGEEVQDSYYIIKEACRDTGCPLQRLVLNFGRYMMSCHCLL